MSSYSYNYGDSVYVLFAEATPRYGSVCGMRTISDEKELKSYQYGDIFDVDIKADVFMVEFDNGEMMEVPQKYLKKFK